MAINKSKQLDDTWARSFQFTYTNYFSDIVLQKSGNDGYFVHKCRDSTFKTNEFVSTEVAVGLKLAGLNVSVVDWQGNQIEE